MVILSDIQGLEDFLGDMDFKVTRHRRRASPPSRWTTRPRASPSTSWPARCKQAKEGRAFILQTPCSHDHRRAARAACASTAPRIDTIHIPVDKIRDVIGSGGKVIRGIQDETGASIDIQEDGTVHIGGAGEVRRPGCRAPSMLGIVKVPEVGRGVRPVAWSWPSRPSARSSS